MAPDVAVSCTYANTGKDPFLLVAFDTSTAFARVTLPTTHPVRIPVPPNAHWLIACVVAKYRSDYGQDVNAIEGWATLTIGEAAHNVPLQHTSDASYVCGRLTMTVDATVRVGSRQLVPEVDRIGEKAVLDRVCDTNMRWYIMDKKMQPVNAELRHIQIPYLNGLNIPGWCFMMDRPVEPCSNAFYDNCVERILMRRRWSKQTFLDEGVERRAILCIEAMQAVANHFLYITDYKISREGKRTEVDVFSSIARVISAGDCEDTAKEICMLCHEWQMGSWKKESLAWYGAAALRHYVCALGLGSVHGPKLVHDDYSGKSRKNLLAHAFVMFVPRRRFEAMLATRTGAQRLEIVIPTDSSSLAEDATCMLVGDGTNLKLVDERAMPEPHIGVHPNRVAQALKLFSLRNHAGDRLKAYGLPGLANNFYVDIVSCMPLGIQSIATKQPVYQVYFCNDLRTQYGASFASVNGDDARSSDVRVAPTYEATADELRACERSMRRHGFPPIPAHKFTHTGAAAFFARVCSVYDPSGTALRVTANEYATQGVCFKRAPDFNDAENMLEFFVSFKDVFAQDIVEAVHTAAAHPKTTGLYLFPEYFSETAYGVMLVMYM